MTRKILARHLRERLQPWYRLAAQTAHLMVGLPDYATYVEHRRRHHPNEPVMSRDDFFRDCQARRYAPAAGRGMRCC
jgi:uncharacterized short protein YbdD (DUF466 family)